MRITLFTSNKNRHNYLINLLSRVSEKIFVIQECEVVNSGKISENYGSSSILKKYFENVDHAQNKLFGSSSVIILTKILKFYQFHLEV